MYGGLKARLLNVFRSAKRPWSFSGGDPAAGPIVVPLGLFTGGAILAYATVGGTLNNVNPGGSWPSANIGRLDVTTTVASEIWTGLDSAGLPDGYGLLIKIVADGGTGNSLQILNQDASSSAANQFLGSLQLFVGQQCIVVYNAGSISLWYIG